MRRFWLYCQSVIVALVVLMLTGCAGSSSYLTSISNKNAGSVGSDIPQPDSAVSKCQTQTWCHNGWCSTHCQTTPSDK